MRRLIAVLVAALLALPAAARPAADRVAVAAARLEADWGVPGGWRGINAWQRFVIADGLIDVAARTGDRSRLARLAEVVGNRDGLDGNDDDLWAVLAEVHLSALNGDPALLATARATFDGIVATYWDARCGGGLWWDHARTYKNAITNELLILAAADLFGATGEPRYRDWAERGWRWFDASGMINADGLVNDGLDAACRNNRQTTYTYNQGVIVGGLLALGRIDGDPGLVARAAAIARAAATRLVTANGIFHEPAVSLGKDGPMFKGIAVLHFGHLVRALPAGADRAFLRRFLARNADALWRRTGRGERPIPARWDDVGDPGGAAAQAAGIDLFAAARR